MVRFVNRTVYLLLVAILGLIVISFEIKDVHLENYNLIGTHLAVSNRSKKAPEKVQEETVEEFMKRYSAIHRKRNNYTRKMCRLYRDYIPRMKSQPRLLVNEEHKMVYCQTPKTGTVSWCRIMLILSGYKNYEEVMKMTAPQVSAAWKTNVPRLSSFSLEKQKHIMATYTKFMFVRHPLTRLLSAYKDKIASKNGIYASGFEMYRKLITNKFRLEPKESNEIEFVHFVNMVVANKGPNSHWGEMYKICFPCDIDYDVIGRFEDMENDTKYILTLTNLTDFRLPNSSGAHLTNSSSQAKLDKAYSSIPLPHLADLYHRYKYDFTLFDYEIPVSI
ncbi:carbohydrate sulfotransferase 11-like [Anneissia japonica]|uniref:carbohydrate sulfotransferase 11-like n=1 Tax=Anneissia japonica TaxID=1529436 RepID=UPI0014256306|nr:carbohydrate sulfotransferase 11-like [Anneissia japonica]